MARIRSILFIALAVVHAGAFAGEPVGPKLTPRLKSLLVDEMQQVARATAEIALSIAAGDHDGVRRLGVGVRDSFILKRALTQQDKKDLMSAVPPTFVDLDRHFHATADKLADAAEQHDSELQGFYFSKMLEACVACHKQYAADRFPGLITASESGHKH